MIAGLQRVDVEALRVEHLVFRHGQMFWDLRPAGAVRMRADYAERVRVGLLERGVRAVCVQFLGEEMRGAAEAGCSGAASADGWSDVDRRPHCIPLVAQKATEGTKDQFSAAPCGAYRAVTSWWDGGRDQRSAQCACDARESLAGGTDYAA
jgi:hypothetical protein